MRFFSVFQPCAYIIAVPALSFQMRFLYSDLQPLVELGITPDPHPEGPSSLPVEAPEDIRKELANDRRREGLRKAAVLKKLPRLTEVSPSFYDTHSQTLLVAVILCTTVGRGCTPRMICCYEQRRPPRGIIVERLSTNPFLIIHTWPGCHFILSSPYLPPLLHMPSSWYMPSLLVRKMYQAAAARDSFLRAAGHTTQGSQALRSCAENALLQSVREGDAMSSTLEAQR